MIDRPFLDELKAAANSLESITVRTPLIPYRGGDDDTKILLKPEVLQPVNSFKLRGVFHAVVGDRLVTLHEDQAVLRLRADGRHHVWI